MYESHSFKWKNPQLNKAWQRITKMKYWKWQLNSRMIARHWVFWTLISPSTPASSFQHWQVHYVLSLCKVFAILYKGLISIERKPKALMVSENRIMVSRRILCLSWMLCLVRSRLALIQGKVISAMKEACRQGFLDWSPRLFLAMYECDIQASGKFSLLCVGYAIYWVRVIAEVLGRVYGVISKRKGKIISEDLKDGTPFWQIKALMPVIESFGFSDGMSVVIKVTRIAPNHIS